MKQLFDNRTGNIGNPKTFVSCRLENSFLVFNFEAYDSSLNSFSKTNNDALYNGDVVELFLDLGDVFYYEFEVAPNGATFVATIVDAKPTFISNNFFQSNVKIDGNNYSVCMIIDLSRLGFKKLIRFNAFRIETKGIKPEYILQSLSPTLSNSFHNRDKFLNLEACIYE